MIADFHNDVLTSPRSEDLISEYGASENEIVCAFFKGERSLGEALDVCREFKKKKSDNLYLSFEDISFTTDLDELLSLFELDPVCASLTWNAENAFAGGAYSNGGLKEKGRELIKLLNERSIAVDLAHLNEKSFFEVFEVADKIVCSHACFSGVAEHPRNLKDDQIKALSERGALCGLCFYRPFLTKKDAADYGDIVAQIEYFCERSSPELLCLGSDFNGCEDLPEGCSDYSFERALKDSLSARGFERGVINAIMHDNLSRYLNEKR